MTPSSSTNQSFDLYLWCHAVLLVLSGAVMVPCGIALAISQSRWHIPVLSSGTMAALTGAALGFSYRMRHSSEVTLHGSFGLLFVLYLVVYNGFRIWHRSYSARKPVREDATQSWQRRSLTLVRHCQAAMLPLFAWVQIISGIVAALGVCSGESVPNCAAHFIMGSSFVAYGVLVTILLVARKGWPTQVGKSKDFYSSIIMAVCGCFNTFTEHRWGSPWGHSDSLHTSLGILWWVGGLLGVWLSYPHKSQRSQTSPVFAIIIILTGWGMTAHAQDNHVSQVVHTAFGWTLMGAGATEIIEKLILTFNEPESSSEAHNWRHIPPLLYYASGILFMGANEDQMQSLMDLHANGPAYVLVLYSIASLLYLFVNILISITGTKRAEREISTMEDNSNAQTFQSASQLSSYQVLPGSDFYRPSLEGAE